MAMRFEHEFTVPVPVEQAWSVLLDVERVAPCLPGAALESVEDEKIMGRMKVKVGPITVTYRGTASFQDVDKDARSLTIKASGKEARGAGTASATVAARLRPEGPDEGSTKVTVETTFNVTGRPAQFGRGVMAEVGGKLIDRFAENLSALLSEEPGAGTEAVAGATAGTGSPTGAGPVTGVATPEGAGTPVGLGAPGGAGATPAGGGGVAGTDSRAEAGAEERHLAPVPGPEDAHPDAARHEGERRAGGGAEGPAGVTRASRTPEEEALDLLEIAGAPLLKRLAPVVGVVAALFVLVWVIRRVTRSK
jgi:carbon monoxide dehydrogenase subunit G